MKRIIVWIEILMIICVVNAVPKGQKSSPKKPLKISAELYCSSCIAILKEAIKKLRHRKSEMDVFDALDGICKPDNFYVYEFPPPEMREGCEAFIADWEETLEKNLMNRTSSEQVINTVCNEITLACQNTNPADAPRFDDKIFVDGQPVDVKQNSKESSKPDL